MCTTKDIVGLSYRLMRIKGFGPVQTNKILFSMNLHVPLEAAEADIAQRLTEDQRVSFRQSFIMPVAKSGTSYLSVMDDEYPEQMRRELSSKTPPVLTYMGNLQLLKKKKVGFCGSRKVSEKGISITVGCASQLAEKDICIVSGYAEGVDKTAHLTALKSGGTTIIVLPEGINGFSVKREYESVWDWNRVLVISEFAPSDPWLAGRAMTRNATIISLSDAVVVIEAGEKGGSMDAGLKTLKENKKLFVTEYKDIPESAAGNATLLRRGACPIKRSASTLLPNTSAIYSAVANKAEALFF